MSYRWIHVAGVDAAQGGVGRTRLDQSEINKADDFSMSTWRMLKTDDPKARVDTAELVNLIRYTGLTDKQQSAVVHRMHEKFDYELIVLDPGGGGLFVRDELREPIQRTGAEEFQVCPIITRDDEQLSGVGDPVLAFFSRADTWIKDLGLALESDSVLINKAHEVFRAALDARPQRVRFPARSEVWGQMGFGSADQMRAWLNDAQNDQGAARARAEIDLALVQMAQVGRKLDRDMKRPHQDRYGMYEYTSGEKKDAAYGMLYGYFGCWMLMQEWELSRQKDSGDEHVFSMQSV
ncbi:MAG: hypothetical protein HS116_25000 [Planctomycetes bacterium]|nr:hypothetical protein [Planctomycetota bacterium]